MNDPFGSLETTKYTRFLRKRTGLVVALRSNNVPDNSLSPAVVSIDQFTLFFSDGPLRAHLMAIQKLVLTCYAGACDVTEITPMANHAVHAMNEISYFLSCILMSFLGIWGVCFSVAELRSRINAETAVDRTLSEVDNPGLYHFQVLGFVLLILGGGLIFLTAVRMAFRVLFIGH